MTGGPWRGGLSVRRMEKGQTPVADFLCTACWHHRRISGRDKVTDFLRSNPTHEHRIQCPGRI